MTEIPTPQQMPLLQQQAADVQRADLILLTYDGTDRQSYQQCLELLRALSAATSGGKMPVVVLRTKADLPGCRPLQLDVSCGLRVVACHELTCDCSLVSSLLPE